MSRANLTLDILHQNMQTLLKQIFAVTWIFYCVSSRDNQWTEELNIKYYNWVSFVVNFTIKLNESLPVDTYDPK